MISTVPSLLMAVWYGDEPQAVEARYVPSDIVCDHDRVKTNCVTSTTLLRKYATD